VKTKALFLLILFLGIIPMINAQQDSLTLETEKTERKPKRERKSKEYNPLAPAKAAFYSAILPGLGQAYNGRYWKIPIAYAGLGTGVYFYLQNDKQYDRYRNAYKDRLAGRVDEFEGRITTDGLIRGQEFYQKNKEISILVTVGVYLLNIIDANVDAHLQQFNVDEDLSFRPKLNYDQFSGKTNYAFSLNFNF
tara:strand:+ start:361 stop:939 length:579 start_codon:yes stop_codon:yes gene_type:complete